MDIQNSNWEDFKKWWIGKNKSSTDHPVLQFYDEHPLIAHAVNVANVLIAVIDVKSMHYTYASPNSEAFTGWGREPFQEDGVKFSFNLMHPPDQKGAVIFSELINN